MAFTYTIGGSGGSVISEKIEVNIGSRAMVMATITMPTSYAFGGESFDPLKLLGFNKLDHCVIESANGVSFQYDYANDKVKAYMAAPPIVYEEKQTPTDDVATTKYPAAFFMNVARSGNNKKFRSTGIALASLGDDEISLVEQMAAGERTQLTVKDYDRLAGDGAFTTAATNWTFSDSKNDWTEASNALNKDQDGTETITHDNFAAVIGRTYRLTFTISNWTVGTVTATLGGTAGTAVGADGTYVQEITATTTDGLVFTPTNTSRFTLDSVTVYDLDEPVYLTYVTQAWREVWENLVQDEAKTLATGANTLTSGNKIAACMYIDQTTATAAALTMIDQDDTVASGEVDLLLNSATSQFTVHSAQNAKAVKTTYIKVPSSGFLADRLVTNETATKAGGDPYTNTFDYPILLWGYTGCMPVNTGTTQVLIDYAGTPAAGEAVIDWFTPGVRGAGAPAAGGVIGTKSDVTGTGAYIWGTIDEIVCHPIEVPDGMDLDHITVRAMFIGN